MRRLFLGAGVVVVSLFAGVVVGPTLQASPQAAAKAAQQAPAKPAKPSEPQKAPEPTVPPDYKGIMDAGKIEDPAKRAEALQRAVMSLFSRSLSETPERKALTEAMRMTDPARKVEALQKFVRDFPKSSNVNQVHYELVATMIADAKKRITDQANLAIDAAPDSGKAMMMNNVADKLMVGEILLDQAEIIINRSLAAWDETAYVADQKKSYDSMVAALSKAQPGRALPARPTDEALSKQFRAQRAYSQTTQGEIFLKQNRIAEAEKVFKDLYAAQPSAHATAMAAGYLGDIARKAGKTADVVEYLAAASLSERLTPARRKDLEAAWRALHAGSLDGLDAMLDARYEKSVPKPHVTPYLAPKERTNRVALAEIFTGAGCPPCVGIDLAFEGALDRYKGEDLAVLMYHLHIPLPDPLTNPSTENRSKFYRVQGVPAFYLDGVTDDRGGGPAESATAIYKDRVEPAVEKRLTTKPDAKLVLQASHTGSAVRVTVRVDKPQSAAKHLRLHIALAEEQVRYTGENGVRVHPMVVRSLAGKDAGGFPVAPGKGVNIDHTFDLSGVVADAKAHLDAYEAKTDDGKFRFSAKKHEIDPKRLVVVAFLQDEDTKAVLQAAYVDVRPAGTGTGGQ